MPSRPPLRTIAPAFLILLSTLFCAVQAYASSGPWLSGQILDAQGQPLEGATAELVPLLTTAATAELLLEGHPGPPASARVMADAKTGAFRLQAPDSGMWRVRASAPGHLSKHLRLLPLIEDLDVPPARLEPATSAAVRLLTQAGEPVGNAALAIYRPRPEGSRRGGPKAELLWVGAPALARTASADSDADLEVDSEADSETDSETVGVAHFQATPGEEISIQAIANGHPQLLAELRVPDGQRAHRVADLVLESGEPTIIEVSDSRGRALAGVFVRDSYQPLPLGRTDETGRLAVTLEGKAALWLFADDGSWAICKECLKTHSTPPEAVSESEKDAPEAHDPAILELTIRPPSVVSGIVRDEATGEAMANALAWPGTSHGNAVHTNSDGSFELIVSDSREIVRAIAPGYLGDQARFPPRTGGAQVLALHLRSRSAVSGRIIDGAGQPAGGVEILPQVVQRHRSRAGQRPWTTSDADGRFHLEGLRSGEAYRVSLWGDNWADTVIRLEPLEAGESRHDQEWRISRGMVGVGRVVDEGDLPVAGATVTMRLTSASRSRDLTATTDAEGHFSINALAPQRYDLHVMASGFATAIIPGIKALVEAPIENEAVAFGEERETDLGVITLSPGIALSGNIKDSNGQAIAGATIDVDDSPRNRRGHSDAQALSDSEGNFRVADRRQGETVNVHIAADGYQQQLLPAIEVTEEPISIVLEKASLVFGQVIDEQGNAVFQARVFVIPKGSVRRFQRSPATTTDAQGQFEIDGLIAGLATVNATKQGFRNQQIAVEIGAPGQPSEAIQIVLEIGMLFQGTILGPSDQPLSSVMVNATRGEERYHARSDANGHFDFPGLSPGLWTLQFHHDDHFAMTRDLEFDSASAQTFRFPPGVAVSGRVLDRDDTPVAHCSVYLNLQDGSGTTNNIDSDTEGAFTAPHVAPGTYQVGCFCMDDGLICGSTELEVANGPLDDVIVRVPRGGEDKGTLVGTLVGVSPDDYSQVSIAVSRLLEEGAFFQLGNIAVDFEGAFVVENLPAGVYQVIAQLPRGRQAAAEVQIDGREAFVELKPVTGFRLSGVLRPGGKPSAGIMVALSSAFPANGRQALTGPDGGFFFEDVPAGTYQLFTSLGDTTYQQRVVIDGDLDLVIEPKSFRVSGRVRAADGRQLSSTLLNARSLETGKDGQIRRDLDADGSFVLEGLENGRWRFEATIRNYGIAALELQVDGDVANLELVVDPGQVARFKLLAADGTPVSGVMYAVTDLADTLVQANFAANAQGQYSVQVPAGGSRLWLQTGLGMAQGIDVPATSDGEADLGVLQLAPTATLKLKSALGQQQSEYRASFRGPSATPLIGMDQTLSSSLRMFSTMTAYVFPGNYTLTLVDGAGQISTHEITAVAGQELLVPIP